MELIERLKESYRNGERKKVLLRRKETYYSAINGGFQGHMFYDGIVIVNQKLNAIPKPRGFLEELAYNMGSR